MSFLVEKLKYFLENLIKKEYVEYNENIYLWRYYSKSIIQINLIFLWMLMNPYFPFFYPSNSIPQWPLYHPFSSLPNPTPGQLQKSQHQLQP